MADGAVQQGRLKSVAGWILAVLLALAFFAAGGAKLAGNPAAVAAFAKIGFGQWFRLLTGAMEVAGAIGLLIRRLRFPAAVGLALLMAAAVGFHLTVLGGNPTAPVLLCLINVTVAWISYQLRGPGLRSPLARTGELP